MFGRKKKNADSPEASASASQAETAPFNDDDVRANGPYDVSEIESKDDYLDLGSILIKPQPGVGLRLEVDEKTKRPRAITLDVAGSTAQVQAFAAPKTAGLWEEIRQDLTTSLQGNNGAPEAVEGTFGTELRARFPAKTSQGTTGYRPARFVGIDGPRWFLRTVISGAAAIDPEASKKFDELIRGLVVVRGKDPMPPRDLLPLNVPEGAQRVGPAQGSAPPARPQNNGSAQSSTTTQPPERGPEIAEVR
ncbi:MULTISPECIES: DUF3710 domain-containing protein [Kocuria]|uniref:DUF3710 domain-containing protein n=1 Tax=Kocuria subflava TaxID=1736139 RepID=A0A846TKF2_9MICC|nr:MULTISPECIES: DUF3710 domain-containing protein [Kocuria]NKE08933.1 DUF3710 domain-containing protein [Kocuria subflava]